eukprot:TRINITY_DN91923_c0_g1_i1.p1 TRINITY_DN91923_c0_g1~~TRINITY_DN91923_c0_g1_i1.p1  ORF type:complete len:433 (-),score=55.86 TRINITY_DN91923_c0_g1_i1:114-1412(-)
MSGTPAPETHTRNESHATAMRLHAQLDSMTLAGGSSGTAAIVAVLADALTGLGQASRVTLAARLRSVLHESITDSVGDAAALKTWGGILEGHSSSKAVGGAPDAAPRDRCASQSGMPQAAGQLGCDVWATIFRFIVSLEALRDGLHAVNRHFRRFAVSESASWRGCDVTFEQAHFRGGRPRGDAGWCEPFSLLPAMAEARTIRLAGFSDSELRDQVLQPFQRACRTLCPRAQLIDCSFCEQHCGPQIELPTPRRLTAMRRDATCKGEGLLLGTGALLAEPTDGNRSFLVRIESLTPGDRIDIGVTALSPHAHFAHSAVAAASTQNRSGTGLAMPHRRRVSFAEDLASSWVIESSGLLVGSHAGLRFRDERWNARRLRAGDEVKLDVTANGDIQLLLNGKITGHWRAQVPRSAPVYPVIDLFEGSIRLSMLPA